ncbi:hypothetical protein [Shewanella sedimentimangrovi]|uniref:Orphan protein n=1 Tax=Shewanella sedimentimangrovi TaxID=2814293 RepID=A0ABX7R645_9GAMM|nr:hypothetical protein [Shewanella sedimentimangrovi]QSX38929.1 hypothetical protein JYB85_09115 [Shewanella sedimentimangrovi]
MNEQQMQLTLLARLEPGCLGPDGLSHIAAFCALAQRSVQALAPGVCQWRLEPRLDKTLPELEFSIANRQLSREQADRYLELFDLEIDSLEERFHTKMAQLINQFLARQG